jgi:hypothetical protein
MGSEFLKSPMTRMVTEEPQSHRGKHLQSSQSSFDCKRNRQEEDASTNKRVVKAENLS